MFGLKEVVYTMSCNDKIKFASDIIKRITETLIKWEEENNLSFNLCSTDKLSIRKKFVEIDREKYGIIDNITNKEAYSNNITEELKKLNKSEAIKIKNILKLIEYDGIFYYYSIDKNVCNLNEVIDI